MQPSASRYQLLFYQMWGLVLFRLGGPSDCSSATLSGVLAACACKVLCCWAAEALL